MSWIDVNKVSPNEDQWYNVLVDNTIDYMHSILKNKPDRCVTCAKVLHVDKDDGGVLWAQGQLDSGAPFFIINNVTHYQPLPGYDDVPLAQG